MKTYFVDTETIGFHGLPVLLQYAIDDGPVETIDLWEHPFRETLALLRDMMASKYVGFNNVFDIFHINKLWNIWKAFENSPLLPISLIDQIAVEEERARDGDCVVPACGVDLMIHARRGKYQSTQDRKDIKVRNVPTELAEPLAKELDKYIRISDIHFARKKTKKRWHILESSKEGFSHIVLKFAPSTALKALVVEAGIVDKKDIIKLGDIMPSNSPVELGFAPFALAISTQKSGWRAHYKIGRKTVKTGFTWPALIESHILWWKTEAKARLYAANDIKYTRELYNYLEKPDEINDDILASYVAATRWKGFAVDIEGVKQERERVVARVTCRVDAATVRAELLRTLNPIHRAVLAAQNKTGISTGKVVLEKLSQMGNKYAAQVLDSRKALKEIELYDKLLIAGRLHASLKVGGTLSNRMAGADGLNVQAINNLKRVRCLFPLANFSGRTECTGCKMCREYDKESKELTDRAANGIVSHGVYQYTEKPSGGDFESFEVVIADAIYDDSNLRKDLLTCEDCGGEMQPFKLTAKCNQCGGFNAKKIHGLMGMALYPGNTYEQVKKSKSTENDMYTNGKRGVFALLYGGTAFTISTKIGIGIDLAEKALESFIRKYIQIGIARAKIAHDFTALRQPGGNGSKVFYSEPKGYIENMYGFRRYFTLENLVIKRLFELSNDLPANIVAAGRRMRVQRREREQTGDGAVRTALLGAAFGQLSANIRAAQNTEIQSSGAESTKQLQVNLVSIQPRGINPWVIRVIQVHDSLNTVSRDKEIAQRAADVVQEFVDELRHKVPLLGIDWQIFTRTWAD
jgi:hypothetical protein